MLLLGFIDASHATFADEAEDPVAPDRRRQMVRGVPKNGNLGDVFEQTGPGDILFKAGTPPHDAIRRRPGRPGRGERFWLPCHPPGPSGTLPRPVATVRSPWRLLQSL